MNGRSFLVFAIFIVLASFAAVLPVGRAVLTEGTRKPYFQFSGGHRDPSACCLHQRGQAVSVEESRKPNETPRVIDINRASAEDFARLPGVGPAMAKRIVDFRVKHGPFRRVEDLLAIRGIGLKKWKAMRPYLRIGKGPVKRMG